MGNLDYPKGFEKKGEIMSTGEQFIFPDGEYDYTVIEAEAVTYSTGKEGINLTLEGVYNSGKTFKCYERVFFTLPAKPRYEAFLVSIGLDPANKPGDTQDIIGMTGRGAFIGDPDKENQWPKVRFYITAQVNGGKDWSSTGNKEADAPF
jgi:hypothetical protein